jgi:hypothetical protein
VVIGNVLQAVGNAVDKILLTNNSHVENPRFGGIQKSKPGRKQFYAGY